jgi:large subunit ribosomal protein L25
MKEIILQAENRKTSTKGAIKSLRAQGRVPGVAYGDGPALPISLDAKSLQSALQSGRNALMTLKLEQTSHPVLVKEIQRHAITRQILHIDLHRVSLKQKVEALVPLHVKGEAPGVKLGGGVLEHVVRDVRVRCLPTDIPPSMDVDVSMLQVGQSLKAKDLHLPEGVDLLIDPEGVIINIVSPTILEEPTAAAAPAAAGATEPEVIKKGKVEEGEEGAAAPAGDKKAAAAPAAGAKPEAKKPEGK